VGQSAEELRSQIETTREDLGATVDAITDHVSPSRMVQRRKERVSSRLTTAKEALMGSASSVQSSLTSATDAIAHGPHAALAGGSQAAVTQTKGQPIMAGALAFGVGFLAAAVLPGSRTEGQLAQKVQEAAQPVVEELKQAGQEAASALKDPAMDSVNQLKDAATSGIEEVRSTAQGAVGDVKSTISEASQEIRDQAKDSAETARGS
jgi:hypothetical protein